MTLIPNLRRRPSRVHDVMSYCIYLCIYIWPIWIPFGESAACDSSTHKFQEEMLKLYLSERQRVSSKSETTCTAIYRCSFQFDPLILIYAPPRSPRRDAQSCSTQSPVPYAPPPGIPQTALSPRQCLCIPLFVPAVLSYIH